MLLLKYGYSLGYTDTLKWDMMDIIHYYVKLIKNVNLQMN